MFLPNGPIDNNSALVQVVASRLFGTQPFPEPMLIGANPLPEPMTTQLTDAEAYIRHLVSIRLTWLVGYMGNKE